MNQPDRLPHSEENEFERSLTAGLRPVDPPAGFAERTLARAHAGQRPAARVLQMPDRTRLWIGGAIAATLLLSTAIVDRTHIHHQRQQAERAQREFQAGMRITDHAIEHTRQQLRRAGIALNDTTE